MYRAKATDLETRRRQENVICQKPAFIFRDDNILESDYLIPDLKSLFLSGILYYV